MKEYWNNRFKIGGKIWGSLPSVTAKHAAALFESVKVESVLVPGCGYGRHTAYFDRMGFDTEGIEVSGEALDIAKKESPQLTFYEGSVLDMPFSAKKYDAIYCFNVLHLFKMEDRAEFLKKCEDALKDRGYVYFTVFSELEESFGKGEKTEDNTFESKHGRPVHYFTKEDMESSFSRFEILDTGITEEEENHGGAGHHIHRLRYIFAREI